MQRLAMRLILPAVLSAFTMAGCGSHPSPGGESTSRGQCDPNYEPCVPIDSDVDCAGGAGDGPSYVEGPVRVVGRDIYHLDRDGDGTGCDG
ncbi:MAG: hypothetical protein JWM27_407 [Gemmatimonadetes bacterium]|nr:hypothetical protein [Gemmatimonadota bacterium]